MDAATVAEALRQVLEGEDFPPTRQILSRIPASQAGFLPLGSKYSMLTLVEHSAFWHRVWLGRLNGVSAPNFLSDWRIPAESEWPGVRAEFLEGLVEAHAIASGVPFVHKMRSDDGALKTLLQIAVHDAYHVGQFMMIKRMMKGAPQLFDATTRP